MINTEQTQSPHNVFERQLDSANGQRLRGSVGQDKSATIRDRIASIQPASRKKPARSHEMSSNTARSQNRSSTKRRTVPLSLWVNPRVKAELQRIAEREGVSISATGRAFLEKAIQTNVDMHYGALLQPIIEQAIGKQMRSYSTRLALLLVRVAFASEQTRSLVTNILGRQPGVTPLVLNEILTGSSNTAKGNITRRTPQLENMIAEVERWLQETDGETHD